MAKKRIIDKIKINQSIVKNKANTPAERQRAYLELKRLNSLKFQGNIVKRPNYEMFPSNPKKDRTYEHNYLIFNTDKKNNVLVNVITHDKNIRNKMEVKSISDGMNPSFIGLRLVNKSRSKSNKNKNLKFYDFYESNLNYRIDKIELKSIIDSIYRLPSNQILL